MEGLESIALAVAHLERTSSIDNNKQKHEDKDRHNAVHDYRPHDHINDRSSAPAEAMTMGTAASDKSTATAAAAAGKANRETSPMAGSDATSVNGKDAVLTNVPQRRDFATSAARFVSNDSISIHNHPHAQHGQDHGHDAVPGHHARSASVPQADAHPLFMGMGVTMPPSHSRFWSAAAALGQQHQPHSPAAAHQQPRLPSPPIGAAATATSTAKATRASSPPAAQAKAPAAKAATATGKSSPSTASKSPKCSPPAPIVSAAAEATLPIDSVHELARTAPAPPSPTEDITDIREADVLCGRGGTTNHHPGNIKYRCLVNNYQRLYISCQRREKPNIAKLIVLTTRKNGGRFLRRNKAGSWNDVGNIKAREKTSQALREGAPELRGNGGGKDDAAAMPKSFTVAPSGAAPTSRTSTPTQAQRLPSPPPPPPPHHLSAQMPPLGHMAMTASSAGNILALLHQQQQHHHHHHHHHAAMHQYYHQQQQHHHHQQQQQHQMAHLYPEMARRMSAPTVVHASSEELNQQRAAKRRRSSLEQLVSTCAAQPSRPTSSAAPAATTTTTTTSAATTAAQSKATSFTPVSPTSSFSTGLQCLSSDDSSSGSSRSLSTTTSPNSSPKARGPRLKLLKRRLESESTAQ
mmetsp:Transcript_5708/g.16904  ORF Transcript_5708/g.16904 Transcript_5708/m.16904 type:complete len:636 (-) Transcript_5708:511-2418(-)|eukprot:CAMPEP_0119558396 /NCGR_PEP_ID=MMETSP1352-20130426/10757_1 /TAXON_ID=265584 /ORGANISM="Stauroneis constricta, Strain CCMP1120" /LENGTH=635 /DNA_ID=CAMNT_0007605741 /DNA_START=144 /DNA_END=2051 /DNA_ORIENTATION=-